MIRGLTLGLWFMGILLLIATAYMLVAGRSLRAEEAAQTDPARGTTH